MIQTPISGDTYVFNKDVELNISSNNTLEKFTKGTIIKFSYIKLSNGKRSSSVKYKIKLFGSKSYSTWTIIYFTKVFPFSNIGLTSIKDADQHVQQLIAEVDFETVMNTGRFLVQNEINQNKITISKPTKLAIGRGYYNGKEYEYIIMGQISSRRPKSWDNLYINSVEVILDYDKIIEITIPVNSIWSVILYNKLKRAINNHFKNKIIKGKKCTSKYAVSKISLSEVEDIMI